MMPDIGAMLEAHLGPIARRTDQIAAQLEADAEVRAKLRGVKYMRIPVISGKASGSVLALPTAASGQVQEVPQGYMWSLRELTIEGLATGATPDIVNILRGGGDGRIIWQLNGNQFAQTFGKGEKVLYPGETLTYASVGTFNATGTIICHGAVMEVPAEMSGKFFA